MTIRSLAAAACISLATATTALASTIDLNFGLAGTDVTGTFFGLTDDAMSSATAFTLNGSGFTNFSMQSTPSCCANSITLSGGNLSTVYFVHDSGPTNASQRFIVTTDSVSGIITGEVYIEDHTDPWNPQLLFSARGTIPIPSTPAQMTAVPLPASGLMLIAGILGFAGVSRRKKHSVQT